jgi:hypothetical protein
MVTGLRLGRNTIIRHYVIEVSSLLIGLTASALSQGGIDGYPFEVPADPRSFAMGESFVALPSNPAALVYNPAGLAGLSGIHVSYSQRSLARENDWTLRSFNAAVGTSFGVFAVQYNRDSYGMLPFTTDETKPPVMNTYDYDVAFGYALLLGRGFSIGAAAKYYDYAGYIPDPSIASVSTSSTTPARLFDVGLVYTFRRFHSQAVVEDSITMGMSYQNIGSNPGMNYPGIHMLDFIPAGMPEYFRAGVSYALKVIPRKAGDPSPLEAVISGEYRTLQTSGGPDVWGFGLEWTIDEIVSLRMGGSTQEGENSPLLRYGLGVRLPVRKLGFDLSLQYAVIPWQNLSAFSIDVQYPGGPF